MKEPARPTRYPASRRLDEEIKQGEETKEIAEDLCAGIPDAYEMAKEVNPWKEFNEEWIQEVSNIEKWDVKKGKIEELARACDVLKLSPDGMKGVLPGLRKLAAQTNANISTISIKALATIAKGTRLHFKGDGKLVFVSLS